MTRHRRDRGLILPVVLTVILLISSAEAADLYRVVLGNRAEAEALAAANVDAVKRLSDGYLVLTDGTTAAQLADYGLDTRLVASDVSRDELAVQAHPGETEVSAAQLLYDDGKVRVFRVNRSIETVPPGLARVIPVRLPIMYCEPAAAPQLATEDPVDLDSLISLVSEDSCRSYVEQMQVWEGRYPGYHSHFAARNWLFGKLTEYGCDSVAIDEFEAMDTHTGVIKTWENVLGYKFGSVYPLNHIVICAHWDSTPLESPGADDNATGCAGVLEIARVLCQGNTRFTFVFALFDSEERGLNGSRHYATDAFVRGDSIAAVANMDVIGYGTGIDSVLIAGVLDGPYVGLWLQLADSLTQVGIDGANRMYIEADAGPFLDLGYNALSVYEYILNPYMHSVHDSAVYLDFDYVTRIVKATLAATHVVNATYPGLPIGFKAPNSMPDIIYPELSTPLEITATAYGDASIIPGSVMIHYSVDDAPVVSVPMNDIGGNRYEFILPGQTCHSCVRYYFSLDELTTGLWYLPDTIKPYAVCAATRFTNVFDDDFNTDKGWTTSGDALMGEWERCTPVSYSNPPVCPPSDFDKSGYCYVTDNDHMMGVTGTNARLLSPFIEVPNGGILVQYARWFNSYNLGTPFNDVFKVFIRREGTSFTLVETVGPIEESEGGWYEHEFWANEFVNPLTPIQVMFDVTDTGDVSVLEGGVDAFKVMAYTCDPLIITESFQDWTAGIPYTAQLEAAGGTDPLNWSDKYGDLSGTGLEVSASGMVSGTVPSARTISFTAVVTDNDMVSDEMPFSFQINASVAIAIQTLPDARFGLTYSAELTCTGGTGMISWNDRNDDLTAHGLTLNPEGFLSGTPIDTGTFAFTAHAEDEVGSMDEQVLMLRIGPNYICGDVDNNGVGVDISDITYFVDWMFGSGPQPPIMEAANVDFGIGGIDVDVSDLTYMVDYMFGGGPAPDCD